jgi:hypothetical protein
MMQIKTHACYLQIRLYYIDANTIIHELIGEKSVDQTNWSWVVGAFDAKQYKAQRGSGVSASCDSSATLNVVFVAPGQNKSFTKAYIKAGGSWDSQIIG